jgi:uncharacterized protein (DUF2267 family)
LQTTNHWLSDLSAELGWEDRQKSYHALRTVLHALRDRLPVNAAAHFAAQLPMLVRGFYYDGWVPAKTPVKERNQKAFLVHVTDAFLFDASVDSKRIAEAVFRVVSRHVTSGETEKVKHALPDDIADLWP